jgi:hypothetical protein
MFGQRGAITAAGAAFTCLAGLCSPQPAAAAGLFDLLFGNPRPPVYAPPHFRMDSPVERGLQVVKPPRITVRREVNRRVNRTVLAVPDHLVRNSRAKVTLTPAEQASHLAKFLADRTLRRGDVVVTKKGVYAFNGFAGTRYRISDFEPAERSAAVDKATRNHLAAIQKVNRRGQEGAYVVVETNAPADGQRAKPTTTASANGAGPAASVVASDN